MEDHRGEHVGKRERALPACRFAHPARTIGRTLLRRALCPRHVSGKDAEHGTLEACAPLCIVASHVSLQTWLHNTRTLSSAPCVSFSPCSSSPRHFMARKSAPSPAPE